MSDHPIPLWLDCDPGHDDAIALLLALHHPSLHLLGLSTVFGNASLDHTTRNARSLLRAFGKEKVVGVYPGAEGPLKGKGDGGEWQGAKSIHGVTGLDTSTSTSPSSTTTTTPTHLPPPHPSYPPLTTPSFPLAARDAIMAHPKDTVWIVATGALTNVAVLIERFPEVVGHVRGLSVMGGGVGGGFIGGGKGGDGKGEGEREGTVQSEEEEEGDKRVGNWTWWAEFNIWSDPQAATQIFSHPILRKKTTLIPLDITHQVLATPEVLSRILHGSSSPSETKRHTEYTAGEGEQEDEKPRHATLRPLLHSILTFFAETYRSVFGFTRGPPVHDPVAVAVLLDSLVREDEDEDVEQGGRILPVSRERFGVTVVPHGDKGVEKTIEDERGMGSEGGGTGRREGQGGRTIVRLLPEGEEGVRVPRGVDAPAFWRVVEGCVERAEESLFIGEMEGKGRGR